jgi:hypothetical protein
VKLRGGGTQPASAVSHLGQLRRNVRAQADLRLDPDMRYLWSMPLVHARGGNRCIGCLLSRACPHCGSTSVNSERTAA